MVGIAGVGPPGDCQPYLVAPGSGEPHGADQVVESLARIQTRATEDLKLPAAHPGAVWGALGPAKSVRVDAYRGHLDPAREVGAEGLAYFAEYRTGDDNSERGIAPLLRLVGAVDTQGVMER
jgi:hypothetical protein